MTDASKFRRIEFPLLPRVTAEKLFIKLVADRVDDNVFRRPHRFALFAYLLKEFLDFVRVQAQAVKFVDRIEIDRNRNEHAVDFGKHAMLVLAPLGKPGKILENVAEFVWKI